MNKFIGSFSKREAILSIALIVLVFLVLNPFSMFMPSAVYMLVLVLLVVVVGLFASLIVNETIVDERDQEHHNRAGRVGYVIGIGIILLGIIVQAFQHVPVDGWLVCALLGMTLGKIFSRVYSRSWK